MFIHIMSVFVEPDYNNLSLYVLGIGQISIYWPQYRLLSVTDNRCVKKNSKWSSPDLVINQGSVNHFAQSFNHSLVSE